MQYGKARKKKRQTTYMKLTKDDSLHFELSTDIYELLFLCANMLDGFLENCEFSTNLNCTKINFSFGIFPSSHSNGLDQARITGMEHHSFLQKGSNGTFFDKSNNIESNVRQVRDFWLQEALSFRHLFFYKQHCYFSSH